MDKNDDWPFPDFNAGPREHLHALGVISIVFAQLDASVERLFSAQSSRIQASTAPLIKTFHELSEKKRVTAMRKVFSLSLCDDTELSHLAINLIDCFDWAQNCRNQLLHAQLHPISFYFEKDLMYLEKRFTKTSDETGFIHLSLSQIRVIAKNIANYIRRSSRLTLYLRYAYLPIENVEERYREYRSLPRELLCVEPPLTLRRFEDRYEY